MNKQKDLLVQLNLNYAYSFAANQQTYQSVKEEYQSVSSQLKELLKDPSWITLQEQMKVLNQEQLETSAEQERVQEKIAQIKTDLNNMEIQYYDTDHALKEAETARDLQRDQLLDRMEQIESTYEKLKKNARGEYSRMEYQNANRQREIEENIRSLSHEVRDTMHEYNLRTGYGFEETMEAKDQYTSQYDRLRTVDIEDSVNKTIEARRKCERSFQEEFISTLRAKIEHAKTNLRLLNKALEDKYFQGDRYAFVFEGSNDPTFALYYRILCSNQDYHSNSLFMEELSEQNRMVMDELFARLVAADSSEKNEKLLRDYTDYRKYMKYDIRITHANGDTTLFSKVNLEKSGGETQTPFYVIIAASFDQLAVARKGISNGCLVLFDEAFNNMDENRIEALMRFYRSLNIQLMIAVPEGRVRNIMPYTETTILLVKQNNRILSEEMIRHESES